MKDYATFYNRIRVFFQDHEYALCVVQFLNSGVTKLMYLLYPLLLVYIMIKLPHQLWPYLLVPGGTFFLVGGLRKLINQARPYETWAITPLLPKDTSGQSMPSRHVFSATMISMCFWSLHSYLGFGLLLLTVLLAICRVLGGVHYPKDVLVGMGIGLLAGILLKWCL